MKVLVVGLGSISVKHISALKILDPKLEVYALRSSRLSPERNGVISCYSIDEVPVGISFVVISNPTSEHLSAIKLVSQLGVPLFIEKPLVESLNQLEELKSLLETSNTITYTAFNLRFHPVIQWLKENINLYRVLEVNAYCGSYLPSWRPNKDYRKVYSAIKDLGGGVHLDLTHEIDYLLWIFGHPIKSQSSKRNISDLEIDSVDSARYWLDYRSFNINLTLNYFRRDSKRSIEIITNNTTLECDLVANKITDLMTNQIIYESPSFSINDTYIKQLEYFVSCINKKILPMNSITESTTTMEICLK